MWELDLDAVQQYFNSFAIATIIRYYFSDCDTRYIYFIDNIYMLGIN